MATKRNPTPATVATTPAPTPMLANGYTPTLLAQVQGACALAPSGGRKAPPAPHTVAGMLLALLASGPAPLGMCATAVAMAPSTGKAHALAPLLRYMVGKWGYGFTVATTPTGAHTLALATRPPNG